MTRIREPNDLLSSKQIYYFYHVCRSRSFRIAARELDVAQSALSRQVQGLEADLGVVLLHRGRTSVEPTEAGKRLFSRAEALLGVMADIYDDVEQARSLPRGTVTFALPASFASAFLPQLIERYLADFPNVTLRILEGAARQIEELLVSAKADVGIVVASDASQRLNQEHLISDELYLVGRTPLKPAPDGRWPVERLNEIPLVLPLPPFGTRKLIDDMAARENIPIRPRLEADSPHILKQIILSQDLYTIMPRISCATELARGELHALGLTPSITRGLAIATLAGAPISLAARELARHVRLLCRSAEDDRESARKVKGFSNPKAKR